MDGTPILASTPISIEKGPCVWVKDGKAYSDNRLIQNLRNAAQRAEQPLQFANLDGPFSDASVVHDAGFAPRFVTFGHVRENSHGFEVTRRRNFDQTESVLWHFVTGTID